MTGNELKVWQIEHGMNREELAKLLDVHKATITNWRRGFTKVPLMAELAMQGYGKERGKSDA